MKTGGRYLVAIGVPSCPHIDLPDLPLVENDLQIMTDLLADQGYQRVLADEIELGASSATLRYKLGDWFTDEARSENDYVVVYFAGHGDLDNNRFKEHCLLTSDAVPGKMHTVFPTADLAKTFFGGKVQPKNLLLILDTCFAGAGASGTLLSALDRPVLPDGGAGFWVIATTRHNSLAIDGAFTAAFQAVLCDRHHVPAHRGAYLSPQDIVVAANGWFKRHRKSQRAVASMVGAAEDAQFFNNPDYWQLPEDGQVESHAFWQQAASGADVPGGSGRYFSGRREAIERAVGWVADTASAASALVLTARPGSGKSALFGQLLLEIIPRLGINIDAALQAKDESLLSFTQKLSGALRCASRSPLSLVAELNGTGRHATIFVDGLDEANDPGSIEHNLLRALAACPNVKLLVATRRINNQTPLQDMAIVLDLDVPPFFDLADLIDYVHTRLHAGDRAVRYDAPDDDVHARAAAASIAQAAGTSFLYARMAARATLGLGHKVNTLVQGWQDSLPLPKDIDAAYENDFQRFDAVKRRRFRALLLPLARARGRGLPLGSLWLALANANGGPFDMEDLRELRDEAGFYLVQDEQYGKTVFRLFHQTFVAYLQSRDGSDGADAHYFAALDAHARAASTPLRFDAATEPYIRHHYAAHAAGAGRLEACLEDPALLATIAPDDILPTLPLVRSERSHALASAYKRACHWIRQGRPHAFLCHFALACADQGAKDIMDRLDAIDNSLPWRPLDVLGSASSNFAVYASGGERITALALATDRHGNAVAICGYASGSVKIRSLHDDALLLELVVPMTLQASPEPSPRPGKMRIKEIEVLRRSHSLCIAVAAANDALTMFEVSFDWVHAAPSLVHDIDVRAMCFAERAGAPVLITCAGTTISVWSAPALQCLVSNPQASIGKIYGLTFFSLGTDKLLAAVNDTVSAAQKVEHDVLRIWNLEDFSLRRKVAHDDMSLGLHVHACAIDNRRWLLITDLSGNCLLVDPATGICHYRRARMRQRGSTQGLGHIRYSESTPQGTRVLSSLYEHLETALLQAPQEPAERPGFAFEPNSLSLGSDICRVSDDGALLVAAVGTQLRAYRLDDLLETRENAMGFASCFSERNIRRSIFTGTSTILGDNLGRVSSWHGDGRCLWQREGRGPSVRGLALMSGSVPTLVAAMDDGQLEVLDPENGATLAEMTLPGEIIDLRVGRFRDAPACFVMLRSMVEGGYYYAVRIWNLTTAEEIDTEVSNPTSVSGARSLSMRDFREGEPHHAFCMRDYLKTKYTRCVELLQDGDRLLVLCGGAYGEVGVFDAHLLEEVDWWSINTQSHSTGYVQALSATAAAGAILVCAGNEYGGIALRPVGKPSGMRYRDDAHLGHIRAIAALPGNHPLFVSGGDDGVVNFWNTELALLERIDFGVPIVFLQAIGEQELVVTLATGVVRLRLERARLLTSA